VSLAARVWSGGAGATGEQGDAGGDAILLEVSDTGIGIPSRDIQRVFERFYRVDKGRSRAMGGTGLGLSIVRHILDAHGERVFIDSESGRGSVFGFVLRAV
jgi:signal transduction histidine kinase